jgi:thioredoxin 1
VRDVGDGTFDEAVGGDPVLVDFWAPWCKPCRAIEPILEELDASVPVLRVNIDEHPALSARYGVLAVPTVMLFAAGEARGTVHGARSRAHYERWLAEILPAGDSVQAGLDA